MAISTTSLFTQVISTSTFTILGSMGLRSVSIVLVSGVGQFKGTKDIGAITSQYVPMAVGQSVTISADGVDSLDEIEIDCSAGGVIHLIAKQ
jgi:hypothetical protein